MGMLTITTVFYGFYNVLNSKQSIHGKSIFAGLYKTATKSN